MDQNETKTQYLYKTVTLRSGVLFPTQILSVEFSSDKAYAALEAVGSTGELLILAQKDKSAVNPNESDLYKVGTVARIQQLIKLPNNSAKAVLVGEKRVRINDFTSFSPYIEALCEDYGDAQENAETQALRALLAQEADKLAKLETRQGKQTTVSRYKDLKVEELSAEKVVATFAFLVCDTEAAKQRVLELYSLTDQLTDLYGRALSVGEIFEAERSIAKRVRESVEKGQKEYYLREQIKAIHEELGDDEKEKDDFRRIAKEKKLPDYAVAKIEKELVRLDKMAPNSPEAGVIRTYVEWLLDMPWNTTTADTVDLVKARQILDEDHYGIDKIKERIIEYLAVHTLTNRLDGAILCFVGPPGVGKTSIVSSIARAAGREFVQMSLGGVRDEAEIRGHRRTYIGAMPGRILTGMKNAKVNNPVFLLDEIDKMSSDFRGDPASAMLEVLDPNQNAKFADHYLEIPYDLSQTMFVATANSIDTIPSPLLDRMEVIFLSGYTYNEKLEIAKQYLLPKQLKKNGISPDKIVVSDETLMEVIVGYTKENGVRNLERQIGSIIRKIAVKMVNSEDKTLIYEVKTQDLAEYLGARKFGEFSHRKDAAVGVVTGLAWTSAGGVTLDVETALLSGGKGDLVLTGSMGDVMKESARIALSVVRARAEQFGIATESFDKYDVHVHIPEGATPKDGPSAGITLSTALMSLFSGKKARCDVAITGEVTLTGRVLAIGGLKEKSLAAYMSGFKTLIIPKENEKDVPELPEEVRSALTIIPVETVDQVFEEAILL